MSDLDLAWDTAFCSIPLMRELYTTTLHAESEGQCMSFTQTICFFFLSGAPHLQLWTWCHQVATLLLSLLLPCIVIPIPSYWGLSHSLNMLAPDSLSFFHSYLFLLVSDPSRWLSNPIASSSSSYTHLRVLRYIPPQPLNPWSNFLPVPAPFLCFSSLNNSEIIVSTH